MRVHCNLLLTVSLDFRAVKNSSESGSMGLDQFREEEGLETVQLLLVAADKENTLIIQRILSY